MKSLAEFVAEERRKRARKCKTCNLPPTILQQVNKIISRTKAGPDDPTLAAMARWLYSEGFDITKDNLQDHKRRHHAKARTASPWVPRA